MQTTKTKGTWNYSFSHVVEGQRDSRQLSGIRLTGEGLVSQYDLRGYFVGERQIVGITLRWRGDLAKRPAGTSGPFVMLRAE